MLETYKNPYSKTMFGCFHFTPFKHRRPSADDRRIFSIGVDFIVEQYFLQLAKIHELRYTLRELVGQRRLLTREQLMYLCEMYASYSPL